MIIKIVQPSGPQIYRYGGPHLTCVGAMSPLPKSERWTAVWAGVVLYHDSVKHECPKLRMIHWFDGYLGSTLVPYPTVPHTPEVGQTVSSGPRLFGPRGVTAFATAITADYQAEHGGGSPVKRI